MQKAKILILFTIVILTWGTTWLAMKFALVSMPPIFATGLRFLSAAPLLFLLLRITRGSLLFPPGHRLFQFCVFLFCFCLPFTLVIYGQQYVNASTAAIIFASMPVAVVLISIAVLNAPTSLLQLAGALLTILSLFSLLQEESRTALSNNWKGAFAIVVAVIMHAFMYVQCKRRNCRVSLFTFNALPCLAAGVLLTLTGAIVEKPEIGSITWLSLSSIIYLGVVAGVFGILCYFSLQKRVSTFNTSLVFICFPVIAVFLESMVMDREFSSTSWILLAGMLSGVFLSLLPVEKRKMATTPHRQWN
ncbi:DMT family transporter [Buttiauxella sp. B2]|uniref:DMT family transporter n=1 Tax=Buttiauxella sp. B2 TaxID=2587812 RepID=UPI00111F1774|nr:DMT family transporter [Buttiauxella sp. B2]TNV14030.1 DMT family transporter [Buttiauxella sp. B2]